MRNYKQDVYIYIDETDERVKRDVRVYKAVREN